MTTYSAATYQPQWIKTDFIDFVLEKFNPLWSFDKIKAKIAHVRTLGDNMYELHILTNDKFSQIWQAGQSVLMTVQIEGVHYQRSYSIVDITAQGHLVLGIKAQGMVSRYLTQQAWSASLPSPVIELSNAQGDFTLHQGSAPALLIASGSGITAIYALIKQAVQQKLSRIDVIYFNRSPVYHQELTTLAQKYPQLHYHFFDTASQQRHFDEALLNELCPDWQTQHTYICGARSLMQSVQDLYDRHQKQHLLHREYFQTVVDPQTTAQPITFRLSQREFQATQSLLVDAETAGLKPAHGCRMGICNTCTCTKVSGITKNLVTGEIESEDHRPIKLCISQALSPVVIDL